MKKINAYSYLKSFKKEMILGPIFKMLEVVFELLTPFIISYIIDVGINRAINDGNYLNIIIPDLIIIGFCLLGFLSTLVCQYYASIASQGFGTKIRDALYKKILGLSASEFEKIGKANLNTIIINDSVRLQTSVAMMIRLVLRAPAIVLGSLICAFVINWKIGLIFLGLVAVISTILYFVIKESTKRIKKAQEKTDDLVEITSDSIYGTRYIRSFNLVEEEINVFKEKSEEYRKSMMKVNFINALTNPFTMLVINVTLVLIIYLSLGQIIPANSDFTKGNLASLVQYLNQISIALVVVLNLIVIFNKAFSSKRRIEEVLSIENSIIEKDDAIDVKTLNSHKIVEFCGVFYGFSKDFPVLKDINLSINKGEIIGIIGGTGSGKTTLAKLIKREFDPTSGTIKYKGEDLKNIQIESLRNDVSHVLQNPCLFKGTIKTNFLNVKANATDEDIICALKKAYAYDFVKKYDDFLDHFVAEGGTNFSGGQRQRLCLALGFIKDSNLMIFDDSTSALDNLSIKEVNKSIKNEKEKTAIIISQKINAIKFADRIVVLDKGEIIDIGTHEELVKKCDIYREIFDSQKS